MLPRTLEPEVMDTREEAVDYDSMDHSEVNRVFVNDLIGMVRTDESDSIDLGHVLDAGTGTALIPIELCQRSIVTVRVTAADAAKEMLSLGQRNVDAASLGDRVTLVNEDCKRMSFANDSFDTVISNSIVHHIPEPIDVFREMARVLKSGGCLFVRDLLRPENNEIVDQIVATYAGDANDHQQKMFRESLHASLTVDEVRELLQQVDLPVDSVRQTTDRHWTIEIRSTKV